MTQDVDTALIDPLLTEADEVLYAEGDYRVLISNVGPGEGVLSIDWRLNGDWIDQVPLDITPQVARGIADKLKAWAHKATNEYWDHKRKQP